MNDALKLLDESCQSGNTGDFFSSSWQIFKKMDIYHVFEVCIHEASVCLEILPSTYPKTDAQVMLKELKEGFPNYPLESLMRIAVSQNYSLYFEKGLNCLYEAATKSLIDWQITLLEEAHRRLTIFRIVHFHFTQLESNASEVWESQESIDFRKWLFSEFRKQVNNY